MGDAGGCLADSRRTARRKSCENGAGRATSGPRGILDLPTSRVRVHPWPGAC